MFSQRKQEHFEASNPTDPGMIGLLQNDCFRLNRTMSAEYFDFFTQESRVSIIETSGILDQQPSVEN